MLPASNLPSCPSHGNQSTTLLATQCRPRTRERCKTEDKEEDATNSPLISVSCLSLPPYTRAASTLIYCSSSSSCRLATTNTNTKLVPLLALQFKLSIDKGHNILFLLLLLPFSIVKGHQQQRSVVIGCWPKVKRSILSLIPPLSPSLSLHSVSSSLGQRTSWNMDGIYIQSRNSSSVLGIVQVVDGIGDIYRSI